MDRKTSRFTVKVFDPNRDPSVAEMLKAEMEKDARVVGIRAPGKFGLIATAQGTFWLDDEGVGNTRKIESEGCPVEFYRSLVGGFEVIPFATAKYSLEECKACETGEVMSLDKFIGAGGRKDENYARWESFLAI